MRAREHDIFAVVFAFVFYDYLNRIMLYETSKSPKRLFFEHFITTYDRISWLQTHGSHTGVCFCVKLIVLRNTYEILTFPFPGNSIKFNKFNTPLNTNRSSLATLL